MHFIIILFLTLMHKQNHNPNLTLASETKTRLLYSHDARAKTKKCNKHEATTGRHFCHECLCYNVCPHCQQHHEKHTIQSFADFEEAKEATKQYLLVEVEQTLNRLKGRQNELKNQVEEINLIRVKLRQMSADTINSLKFQIDELSRKINHKIQSEFDKYEKELDAFYHEYNTVNDYLRENLLRIIDGEIRVSEFGRHNVTKDIDTKMMPSFGKIKQVMEKSKKYLKNIKTAITPLENSIRYFSEEQEKSQGKFEKYDRFLKQRCCNQSEYNSPLLRTLSMLESNPSELTLIKSKLRN